MVSMQTRLATQHWTSFGLLVMKRSSILEPRVASVTVWCNPVSERRSEIIKAIKVTSEVDKGHGIGVNDEFYVFNKSIE